MRSSLSAHSTILLRGVPASTLAVTAVASTAGSLVAIAAGWPLWAVGLAAVVPWMPSITAQAVSLQREYAGMGLFYVLVVTQGAHFLEHVAQMIQIHALALFGPGARGVFGVLDVEWVHFVWSTAVIAIVVLLLLRFRHNPWLVLTAGFAGWHEIEHLAIMVVFLGNGLPGGPGLLAAGGAIGGGLPLTRPDLHFLYNLLETTTLAFAFLYQASRLAERSTRRSVQ